jgi:transcriptional regulator with XRE-family HTH domain
LRTERALTQEHLAGKDDLTTSFVNAVEHGRKIASFTTIMKLARGLDLPPSELFRPFDKLR